VNADDAAFQVEQRAARVAAHQGAVGAKDRLIGLQNAAQADDGRAARTEPARMAGPDAPLPFLQLRRLPHLDKGVVALGRDLDETAVDAVVGPERLAFHDFAVGKDDVNGEVHVGADVAGRQDMAFLVDNDAAAGDTARVANPDRGGNDLFEDRLDLLLDRLEVGDVLGGRLVESRDRGFLLGAGRSPGQKPG